ncbi:MAG: putative rane protein [Pseudonocardiales bacterium]|nr:putative rane protein [Pseudonocardiales bacterium]
MTSGTDVDAEVVTDGQWRRLDPRMLVVTPVSGLVRLLPAFAVLLLTGREGDLSRVWFSIGGAAIIVLLGALRWRFTQYRITAERVELHSGWLRRQRRSVPRDRIRTVDLTSRLEHRIFGLSVVKVGAATGGSSDQAGLSLDAVSRTEAERLRRELLDRSVAVPAAATTAPPSVELARLDWAWLRFAPLTFSSLAGVGVVAGAAFNLLNELGVSPRVVAGDAVERLARAGVATAIGLLAITLLLAAVIGSLLLFVARWSGYRLTREPDGTIRVSRGLLTRRSLSVSEGRLRGVEIAEAMLLRAGRGAQTRALSAGLTRDAQGGVLQPPVPRAEAHRVASAVAQAAPAEITDAPLHRHPAAAGRRRMTRALGPTVVLIVAAFLVDSHFAGPLSLLLLPAMALVGWDRARVLGHTLTGGYLVVRQGSVVRRTVALQRAGVIGWRVRQSPFQRRAGVVTVEAVTGAGSGAYPVIDVGAVDAIALMTEVTPNAVAPLRL